MIQSLKQIKRMADARVGSEETERDEEGRAVIAMTVLRDEDFLSDFSAGKRPTVSPEVAEYLNESALPLLPAESVCLRIYSDCTSEEEKPVYSAALKEYYMRRYRENRLLMRRNAIFSLIMALIGLAALAVTLTVSYFGRMPILSEALDIFSWVFLWEAVDLFFLERTVLRAKRNRCLRFLEADIRYLPRTRTQTDGTAE